MARLLWLQHQGSLAKTTPTEPEQVTRGNPRRLQRARPASGESSTGVPRAARLHNECGHFHGGGE
ncbi:unnamed protein product [Nesidiocoris tenuis]|uniref:Uncharacterized protein n=1 Tax=Nesidiocoris tenuis TaxID=355587 RepID=A0A6H5GYV3_9HEMI|nr:unnamed protein product [Nesidiocoris tenuis]